MLHLLTMLQPVQTRMQEGHETFAKLVREVYETAL